MALQLGPRYPQYEYTLQKNIHKKDKCLNKMGKININIGLLIFNVFSIFFEWTFSFKGLAAIIFEFPNPKKKN